MRMVSLESELIFEATAIHREAWALGISIVSRFASEEYRIAVLWVVHVAVYLKLGHVIEYLVSFSGTESYTCLTLVTTWIIKATFSRLPSSSVNASIHILGGVAAVLISGKLRLSKALVKKRVAWTLCLLELLFITFRYLRTGKNFLPFVGLGFISPLDWSDGSCKDGFDSSDLPLLFLIGPAYVKLAEIRQV